MLIVPAPGQIDEDETLTFAYKTYTLTLHLRQYNMNRRTERASAMFDHDLARVCPM